MEVRNGPPVVLGTLLYLAADWPEAKQAEDE